MVALPNQSSEDGPRTDDPCAEEIARRAAEVRRGWSGAQRKRRRVYQQPTDWQLPVVSLADMAANLPSSNN